MFHSSQFSFVNWNFQNLSPYENIHSNDFINTCIIHNDDYNCNYIAPNSETILQTFSEDCHVTA